VWDRRTGEPVYNAIVWQDRRTAPLCDALKATGCEPLIAAKTGLLLDPYFSGTKLRWILDNVAELRARAASGDLAFGTIDSWLIWNLSAGRAHCTDATNASRTLLYDIVRGEWDDQLLAIMDVPREMLAGVGPSSGVIAETSGELFASGIPIAGVAGDQHAALFGQCCFGEGMAKDTYGTGCFMLMNAGANVTPSKSKLLTTVAWHLEGRATYATEGSVFVAGALIQWLRDALQIIRSASDVEALARTVADSGGVYVVPAFAGMGAPHWDPSARGTMLGLTRGTTSGHLARAALEGIAFQVCDVLEAMQHDKAISLTELRVDGGASANDLLMQFQADVLGVPVVRSQITETTALGAAYLAGLAIGFWRDRSQIATRWRAGRVFEPSVSSDRRDSVKAGWRKAVERARGWSDASA
jgi:glycerol kinase